MAIADLRPPDACIPPVLLDPVVDDAEAIREMARASGPYFMPARYLVRSTSAADAHSDEDEPADVPSYLIGPTFRGDWAFGGEPRVEGADSLLHLSAFVDAAHAMTGGGTVVPEQVYVNLTAPSGGQPFSHVDIPEFAGVDRTNAPGWLLQAMGSSRLFEDHRITIITAVSWFHHGERGYFRYWPRGRDAESVRHEDMWNTGVVGDNDFMHHKVERTGPRELSPPAGMTIDTHLDHDGDGWVIVESGDVLARYADEHVRLSLSWKAKVHESPEHHERVASGRDLLTLDEVRRRFAAELGDDFPARTVDDLTGDLTRMVLTDRWNGYRAD